jgi:uncharacterized protein (TIGR00297 family)
MDFVATILPRLALGLLISSLIGFVAYRRGSLSRSGVLGAVMTGTTIFGFGGFTAGVLLVAFFVSSSLLSHFKQNSQQKQRAAEMFDKGGQRDLGQALANGGAAAVFAVIGSVGVMWLFDRRVGTAESSALINNVWIGSMAAVVGALATVNADTWATELGVLSKSKPRLITNPLRAVEPGTSGGVSFVGLLAALAGAVFISMIFVIGRWGISEFLPSPSSFAQSIFVAGTLGGFLGSLFDSFLGATTQAIYYSEARQKETEKAVEKDGTPNKHIHGWKWLNNDWVNFISSVVGALISAALVTFIL